MYYDVNKTLTHNSFINMIIGARGFGKTYGLKKKAISNFLKKGSQFIYLRRYMSELDLIKDNLFNDITKNEEFKNTIIEYNDDSYYINDKLAGYAMALSRSNYYKSASFPDVDLIIFDEFIIDTTQNLRYLSNEVRKLLDFIETIFRMRNNGKVFLLANSLSFINPYSLYWDLKLPKDKNWCKAINGLVLCEIVNSEEFAEFKKQTIFGQLNAGTVYESFSVENKFLLDNDVFIQKKSSNAKYLFTFNFKDIDFGVWMDYKDGLYFVSEHIDKSCKLIFSTTMKNHEPNKLLLKRGREGVFGRLIEGYKIGVVRFETQKIKSVVQEIVKNSLY